MKQIITIILLLLGSIGLMAQTSREDKNLEIARTILENSLKGGFFRTTKVDVRKISGEGVLFDIKDSGYFIALKEPIADSVTMILDNGDNVIRKEIITSQKPIYGKATSKVNIAVNGNGEESKGKGYIIKDFLADYTTLFNNIGKDEVVKVQVSDINSRGFFPWSESNISNNQKVTYTLKGEDIKSFDEGKISDKQLRNRITEKKVVFSKKLSNNIKVFSKVMKDIYDSDDCSTYFISDNPTYDYDDNFGLTINIKTYSSRGENDSYNIPCLGLDDISRSQRNTEVAKMYPTFLKELKENFLNYGTTISGLEDNEQITLKTDITLCKGCGIPKYVQMTTTPTKIKSYITGKADMAACLTTKEGPAQ